MCLLKIPPVCQWNVSNALAWLKGQGWSLKGLGVSAETPSSAFSNSSPSIPHIWEFTSSRSVPPRGLVWPTDTQENSKDLTLLGCEMTCFSHQWVSILATTWSVTTGVSKTPPAMVLFLLSYDWGRGMLQGCQGWLSTPTPILHLSQAPGVPGMVSAAFTLAMQQFPAWSRDASLPNSRHKSQIPNNNSSNQKQSWGKGRMHHHNWGAQK